MEYWNFYVMEYRSNLKPVEKIGTDRETAIKKLTESGFCEFDFAFVFANAALSEKINEMCVNYPISFDWVLKEKNFLKIREGVYGDGAEIQYFFCTDTDEFLAEVKGFKEFIIKQYECQSTTSRNNAAFEKLICKITRLCEYESKQNGL